jgi:ribose transport system permease protein
MKRFSVSPPVAALILAIVLFLLSGFLPNSYGSNVDIAIAQATNIVRLAVFLGVIAAGQTLVIISGSEGIDLSAGSVVTLTAILTYVYVSGENDRVLIALLISLGVGAVIGFLNGIGVTFLRISPFVMTLGMSGVVTGAIIVVNHGNVSGRIAPIMTRLIARPVSPSIPIPGAVVIWLIFGVLMWLLLERTTFGKNLFAIGVNRVTAKLSGVNVIWTNLATYSLAGALAGFGGFLVVGNTGVVHISWASLSCSHPLRRWLSAGRCSRAARAAIGARWPGQSS